MDLLKPIGSLLALVIAFIFVFVFPGSSMENTIIPIIGAVAGGFGLVNWRQKYSEIEAWFKSKTIGGAIITAVLLIAMTVLGLLNVALPQWVLSIIMSLISATGGTTIYGLIDAVNKNPENNKTGT